VILKKIKISKILIDGDVPTQRGFSKKEGSGEIEIACCSQNQQKQHLEGSSDKFRVLRVPNLTRDLQVDRVIYDRQRTLCPKSSADMIDSKNFPVL
jgi:hypothetical protein